MSLLLRMLYSKPQKRQLVHLTKETGDLEQWLVTSSHWKDLLIVFVIEIGRVKISKRLKFSFCLSEKLQLYEQSQTTEPQLSRQISIQIPVFRQVMIL